MTTKVTIDAHAGWDVEYTAVTLNAEGKEVASRTTIIPKFTTADVYIHSGMKITEVKELKEV